MITHGKKTKLQINMWYVSMDVMVIYIQKWAKKLRKCVTLLSLICLCVRIGFNSAKPHIEYCIQRSDFTCMVLI